MKKKTPDSIYGSRPLLCSLPTTVCGEGFSARSQPTRDQDSLRPYQSRHLRVIILSPLDTMKDTELRPMGALGMAWHLLLLTWYGALSAGTYMAWSAGVISDVWRRSWWEEISPPQVKFQKHLTGKAGLCHCSSNCPCDTEWGQLCKRFAEFWSGADQERWESCLSTSRHEYGSLGAYLSTTYVKASRWNMQAVSYHLGKAPNFSKHSI